MVRTFFLGIAVLLSGCQHDSSQHQLLDGEAGELSVLLFTSTDCPIANALVPEFKRLQTEVEEHGGSLTCVHTWQTRTTDEIEKHEVEYGFYPESFVDTKHELVNHFNVTVTPEVVVMLFDEHASPQLMYQGKINNLFDSPGNRRDRATEHYAEDAIRNAMNGISISPDYRKPVGCIIEQMND